MSKKRMSLAELKREDDVLMEKKEVVPINSSNKARKNSEVFHKRKPVRVQPDESDSKATKIDTAKMSVIIPLETFEILQDISRTRRRDNKPFKISDMVREALQLWLEKQS